MSHQSIGVIASSGGSVLASGVRLLRSAGLSVDVSIVTDRACGIEQVAAHYGLQCTRVDDRSRESFSAGASGWLVDRWQCDWVLLLFTRLIGAPVYSRVPCVNLHPSLLPAFPGFGALEAVLATGAATLGATAHLVDSETIDAGPIIAQCCNPLNGSESLSSLRRLSYAQKLYLFLVVAELVAEGTAAVLRETVMKPGPLSGGVLRRLSSRKIQVAFDDHLRLEGIPWPVERTL